MTPPSPAQHQWTLILRQGVWQGTSPSVSYEEVEETQEGRLGVSGCGCGWVFVKAGLGRVLRPGECGCGLGATRVTEKCVYARACTQRWGNRARCGSGVCDCLGDGTQV